jgi:hypothetical protein
MGKYVLALSISIIMYVCILGPIVIIRCPTSWPRFKLKRCYPTCSSQSHISHSSHKSSPFSSGTTSNTRLQLLSLCRIQLCISRSVTCLNEYKIQWGRGWLYSAANCTAPTRYNYGGILGRHYKVFMLIRRHCQCRETWTSDTSCPK